MEPRIQYAKTEDGVSIAYWTIGEGRPLIHTPPPWGHIQLEWLFPEIRRFYERLAEENMLVRYDARGMGMSEREPSDFSLGAQVLDLEAVIDHLGLEGISLFALNWFGQVGVAYAARHPEKVSRLILWNSFARGSELAETPQIQGLLALADKDWELFTETTARVAFGWSAGQPARRYAELLRESVTKEAAQAATKTFAEIDVTPLLGQVRAPTLILQRRELAMLSVNVAKGLASGIPDARMALLEGTAANPVGGDSESVLQAIHAFLHEGDEDETGESALPEGTAIILFLDIADSTALTSQLGDAAYREKESALDALLRSAITEAGGTPVEGKVLGDGVMAVFTSARQAIDAAQRCRDLGNEAGLPLHLGIHAGDVVREGNNVHGGAVQVAARVQGAAATGEILVSATVRDLARTSAGVEFEDRGEHELKGIDEPQRLFAVRGANAT